MNKKSKYFGFWQVGNSQNREPYESNNKNKLARKMKRIARGNAPKGEDAYFCIEDINGEKIIEQLFFVK